MPKKLRIVTFLVTVGVWTSWGDVAAMESLILKSPDEKIAISFELRANPQPYPMGERPYYRVDYKGSRVLVDSPLGLQFTDAPVMNHDFDVLGSERSSHDSTWEDHFGAQRIIRDHYNQLTISLREKRAPGRRLQIVFRAYNEGIAFRYVLPQQETLGKFKLSAEDTGFYFGDNASAFTLNLGRFNSNYEGPVPQTKLDEITPSSVIGLPLLMHIPNGPWVALLEADLTDYAGMYVGGAPEVSHGLVAKLSPHTNHSDVAVEASTRKSTPWRVLLINPRPGGLIESDYLVLNLSAPSVIGDTSWIASGNAAWDNDPNDKSTAAMRSWVDFAAEHHLPYLLTDVGWAERDQHDPFVPLVNDGWMGILPELVWWPMENILRTIPAVDLPNVLSYAKQRDIRVLLWIHWTSARRQMDQAFPLYEKMGLSGFKIDFMNDVPDNQEIVNFYEEISRKAAQHHLVLDIHGSYKPTGLRRTYPNLITQEGVMGSEYNSVGTAVTPEYDVTIPFTRMLAGPLDYTPGCLNNATREQFKIGMCQGTRAHQLAMYVVYLSPLGMVGGSRKQIEAYGRGSGIEFLEQVPTVWDETRVLNGEPAQHVTIARRHGENWYIGSMTNWEPRDLEIPLTFLSSAEYEAQVFADGRDADKVATSLSITTTHVHATDAFKARLAPGGGLALILRPVETSRDSRADVDPQYSSTAVARGPRSITLGSPR